MRRKTVYLVVLLFIISNIFTFLASENFYRQETEPPQPVEEQESDLELQPFIEVLDILTERYLEDVSRQELINAAIHGMVDSLGDPQTTYMSARDWEEIMIKIDGSFSGVGVEITSIDGYITVVVPIKDTPGERAGLLPGDRIIAVDGQDLYGASTWEAATLLRGEEGTTVKLTVERDGLEEPFELEITRSNIVMPSVFPEMLEEKIGYIQITNFDEHTGKDFQEALLALETKGMRGLILDFRGNPGGLLSEAIKMGQEILPEGPITQMVDADGNVIDVYYSYGTQKDYPIVALVNGTSASAAEIICGALQDTGTGILVGTKTYGKATVQHLENISNGYGLRYTIAKYQTPNGRDIHGQGLEPDIVVELPEDFYLLQFKLFRDLKPGDKSTEVLILQRMLNKLSFSVAETGEFDKDTEKAVRAFQQQQGLAVTGYADQAFRTRIGEEIDLLLEQMDTQKQKALEVLKEKLN
ncbi:MAG: S41 family peptidase [Firmicutes bacterium]|nr:S41 family peptidase [Bacillota bacterium]